jgi:hypothetical protein
MYSRQVSAYIGGKEQVGHDERMANVQLTMLQQTTTLQLLFALKPKSLGLHSQGR